MENYYLSNLKRVFGNKINFSGFSTNPKYNTVSSAKNSYSITYIQKGEDTNIKTDTLRNRISDEEDLEQIKYLIEDLKEEGAKVDENGYITVYHNISKYNKKSFEKTGELGGGSNGIIFSTKKDGKIKPYGDKILTFKIPIEKFIWAGSYKNEVLLKIPFKSSYKKINVKKYLVK